MAVQGELFVAVNLCANCLCLWTGGRLSRLGPPPAKRLWASAAGGVLYALAAYAYPLTFLRSILFALVSCYCMVWAAYPLSSLEERLRAGASTLFAGFWLGGCAAFLWSQHLPPLFALAMSAVSLALTELALKRPVRAAPCVTQLEIVHRQNTARFSCMVDSGNLLTDPVTGLPVIVCSRRSLLPVLPFAALAAWEDQLAPGFRLISVRTAAGRSMMMCFRPECVSLLADGAWEPVNAVIAVAPLSYDGSQALVPSSLLPLRAPKGASSGASRHMEG